MPLAALAVPAEAQLDAADVGAQRSYLELVDTLRQMGSQPEADAKQLWRRVVFNILVSNTDDDLRNHAFLREATGWRQSPADDMNPCPVDVRPRVHALAIDDTDPTASLDTALEVAPRFGLALPDAKPLRGFQDLLTATNGLGPLVTVSALRARPHGPRRSASS